VDSAIAGTTTISASTTLTTTQGAANQARQAILVVSSAATGAVTITAPAQSKVYLIANDSSYPATLKASTTSGVTIAAGSYALAMWNSGLATPDFVVVATTSTAGSVSSFHTTSGMGLTPATPSTGDVTLAGTLNPAFGGTGVSTLTGVAYGNGTAAFTAATGTQIASAIGVSPVTNATNAVNATNATTANSAGYVTNAVTFNNGGAGAASGTTYDGSATRTISYNTVGAPSVTGTGASGSWSINAATATSATSSTTATNIAGGAANKIAYQTGASATGFIDAPSTAGYYLQWNGTAFTWAASSALGVTSFQTSLSGLTPSTSTTGSVTLAGTLGVASGGTGVATLTGIPYASGTTAFAAATGAQIATAIGTDAVANATNITGGATGSVLYQSAAGTTAKLSLGTTNYVLTAGASAPQYVAQSTLSVGTATNVAGGAANQIPYQTAAGTTAFTATPADGTYLKYNTSGGFSWAALAASGVSSFSAGTTGLTPNTASTGAVTLAGTLTPANGGTGVATLSGLAYGNGTSAFTAATAAQIVSAIGSTAVQNATSATTATNVAGGVANQIHYQTGAGATSFIAAPSDGTYLKYTTAGGFSWTAVSGIGTVTSVSVTSANGFGGTVATSTTTPAITLTTSITGMIKGNGTAISAATDGTDYVSPTGTATLTNKRINSRVSTSASGSSLTPDVASYDQYNYTALAANLTINAPTGTPTDGTKLLFRILDNGTARTLTWNATFVEIGSVLPTTTTANKTVYVGCVYNANNTRWDVIAVTAQA
jgi:hypothetical protein